MPPKIVAIKIERPKRKYTKKGSEPLVEEATLLGSEGSAELQRKSSSPEPVVQEAKVEAEEEEAGPNTKVQIQKVGQKRIPVPVAPVTPVIKVISLDQAQFGIRDKPMDVYLYFMIEPMGKTLTKYQFYTSRYTSLYDHIICYSGPAPPPDYPYHRTVYKESQTIHPMITLHIKVFYVTTRDYTWKVCMENLRKADHQRDEYGYHFTQLRFLNSPIPPSTQKFAVKQQEGLYIQIPVNLGEFQEKANAEIRALDRALKVLTI